jgi:hypothetical protein
MLIIPEDSVIWLGDFNYRIGLSNEHARALVKKRDLEQLYENDQVRGSPGDATYPVLTANVVEPPDGCGPGFSVLLRGANHVHAHVQIRHRNRRIRHIVSVSAA